MSFTLKRLFFCIRKKSYRKNTAPITLITCETFYFEPRKKTMAEFITFMLAFFVAIGIVCYFQIK